MRRPRRELEKDVYLDRGSDVEKDEEDDDDDEGASARRRKKDPVESQSSSWAQMAT